MGKSHYFVAPPPKPEEGIKYCVNCGKAFPKQGKRKYCSPECYKEATKKIKAQWYQDNRKRINNRKKRYLKKIKKYEKPPLHEKKVSHFILRSRDLIIKRELIKMELLDFQVFSDNHFRELPPVKMESAKYHVRRDRVAFIQERLREFDLFFDQVLKVRADYELRDDSYYPENNISRIDKPWVHKHTADILEKHLELYEDRDHPVI